MLTDQETKNAMQTLIKKTIEANLEVLEKTKNMPVEGRIMFVNNVGYNIKNLEDIIQ
mgnify:CR=1 FL=1